MTGHWCCQEDGTVAMPVFRIDCDVVRLGQVGVPVGVVGAGIVKVMNHEPNGGRTVDLNVPVPKGYAPFTNLKTIGEVIGAVGTCRQKGFESLPEVGGANEPTSLPIRLRIKQQPPREAII